MPNNKKKTSAKKQEALEARRAKQVTSAELKENATKFRALLLSGRKEYAKGRSYEAVEFQKQAIEMGEATMPRFGDDSLVKAHALMEMALAKSAIMTDFATGDEWQKVKKDFSDLHGQALKIYENRVAKKTLNVFRKEECWIEGDEYSSPVPHTERLGPIDYLACLQFIGGHEPTNDTVRSLEMGVNFSKSFLANGCVIGLECGGGLQGDLSRHLLAQVEALLKDQQSVIQGKKTHTEMMEERKDDAVEMRHAGSTTGEMKNTHQKLAKDIERLGLRRCSNVNCIKMESHPKHFATCSRCGWAAYCSRECQKVDWKRHKIECKSGEAKEKADKEVLQNKSKSCLLVGQSQQLVNVARYLHHFAAISPEMASTDSQEAKALLAMVTPRYTGKELGQLQLGLYEVSLQWSAIWSMSVENRNKMVGRFLDTMEKYQQKYQFPDGFDFSVVSDWAKHFVSGDFAAVKHTNKGTILLYENSRTGDIKAYLSVGISQSIESLLSQAQTPLPMYIHTGLFPFKDIILCQGTIGQAQGNIRPQMRAAAEAFVRGDSGGIEIVKKMML